ncbi:MAG: T9SS type A sorting domain-containing protein [Bacteroidota bacterium]
MKFNLLLVLSFFGQLLVAQSFTKVPDTPFGGISAGSISFADIDNDDDDDVLITGLSTVKLYTNDDLGTFTEVLNTPFENVSESSAAFSDVDGDGDEDILIVGANSSSDATAILYANDGMGNFTEVEGTPFDGVYRGFLAFSDIDNDGDEDVLITGINNLLPAQILKLYTNDGSGNFIKVFDIPFEEVRDGSISFADVDGDKDEDVLIVGRTRKSKRIAELFTNDGSGTFTKVANTPFLGVERAAASFADVDGDNDQDVLITGVDTLENGTAKLYINDGMGTFTEVLDTPFKGVFDGEVSFSDIDEDDDQDVLIVGGTVTGGDAGGGIAKLYTNDGMGNFTEVLDTPFEGLSKSSAAFLDIDADGDEDVLIAGMKIPSFERITRLYTNDGLSSATENGKEALRAEFMLFPNPSKADRIYVSYAAEKNASLTVKVFGLDGRLLKQQVEQPGIGEQTFSIDIASFNSGTYIIQLDDGKKTAVHKFLVQ